MACNRTARAQSRSRFQYCRMAWNRSGGNRVLPVPMLSTCHLVLGHAPFTTLQGQGSKGLVGAAGAGRGHGGAAQLLPRWHGMLSCGRLSAPCTCC